MDRALQIVGIVFGVLAFVICLTGGIWILAHAGFSTEDAVSTGIGLYFIGKALFVGPMLIITALRGCNQNTSVQSKQKP